MLILHRQILVPRVLFRDGDWRLVRRHAVHLPVVERIAREEAVAALETVVDTHLPEVLVGRLLHREQILGRAAAEGPPVRVRKERIEVGGNRRMQGDRLGPDDAAARECGEVERPVLHDRPTSDGAELMTEEIGNRLVRGIEEVFRVERGVAVELESGSVKCVGARARHRVDDAARRAPELGRVRVRQHLEFEHRLDAEEHAGRRSGRLVVDVVDVGAVEEEAALLGPRAVDRNLRRAPADHVVAGRKGGRDAGLQQRKLLERPSVERQLANLLVADEPAHGT